MRLLLSLLLLTFLLTSNAQKTTKTENVILITFDGYRWQELFDGAQKKLINTRQVGDKAMLEKRFWAETEQERRNKLMPFFWNTIAREGIILGNRNYGCKVDITNPHRFSYPGYNEIFSGYGNPKVNSNDYPDNPNLTIFDYLNEDSVFKNSIAAFATWDAFPRIINTHRNKIPVFVNFKQDDKGAVTCNGVTCAVWSTQVPYTNPFVQTDTMTYHFAKEYLQKNHPHFAFIGFDETDGFAHEGHYDWYLNAANMLDAYVKDLWNFVQSDPQYKNKTTIIITADHGRGTAGKSMWHHHGPLVATAGHIWLAAIGPDTPALGEVKNKTQYSQNQIAGTIAKLLGKEFYKSKKIGAPIPELTSGK
ncbi:MAG: alkaline phosphatase family protein [Chitinophagales bacterium]